MAIGFSASPEKAEAVVRDLKGQGVRAVAFKADQSNAADVERLAWIPTIPVRTNDLVSGTPVFSGFATDWHRRTVHIFAIVPRFYRRSAVVKRRVSKFRKR